MNKEFNSISYDYYSNTASYVRMILEMLPEGKVSPKKKIIIKELYNFFLNHFDADKISEIASITAMFREKISVSDMTNIVNHRRWL